MIDLLHLTQIPGHSISSVPIPGPAGIGEVWVQGTAATKLYNNRSQLQIVVYDATVYGEYAS